MASLPDFSHQHCDHWILHLKVGTIIAWEASELTAVIFLDQKNTSWWKCVYLGFWGFEETSSDFRNISGEIWGEFQDLNQKNK